MYRRILVMIAAALLFGLTLPTVGLSDEGDEPGPVEVDQTPMTGDETVSLTPSPQPMSPTGPAPPGTFTYEEWSSGETDSENGLNVVSSTAPGTSALTGIVQDESTGNPISGATATLSAEADSPPVATTTDSGGSFAFIDMPPGAYTLMVTAPGYGSFSLIHGDYLADDYSQVTVELNATTQVYDESIGSDPAALTTDLESAAPIGRHTRVPPSIRVLLMNRDSHCNPFSSTGIVRRYQWEFYVLHVLKPEVGGVLDTNITGMRAFESIVQNFGWFHLLDDKLTFDVDDSTNYQCFRTGRGWRPRGVWRNWLQDVLDERIASTTGRIQITQYGPGSFLDSSCHEDPSFPPDGNTASQRGISSLTTLAACGPITDWRGVVDYYYTHTVRNGTAPPNPQTSFTKFSGGITFTFKSLVAGHPVGWIYEIHRLRATGWKRIYIKGWSRQRREVPTSYAYGPITGCSKYRIRAINPVGNSVFSSVNNGNPICPG